MAASAAAQGPGRQRFQAVVRAGHKEDAVEVPFDPAEAWGRKPVLLWPGRRGHRVHAQVGDTTFDGAIVSRSRRHWLLLPASPDAPRRWQPGDTVAVAVQPAGDAAPDADPPP